jgi:hypothetical protein
MVERSGFIKQRVSGVPRLPRPVPAAPATCFALLTLF